MKTIIAFTILLILGLAFSPVTVQAADVVLAWQPSPESDFAEYCIYRADKLEGGSGPWGDPVCGIAEPTYTDTIPGVVEDYVWLVTAKDLTGNESKVSNMTWKEKDKVPPAQVVEVRIVVEIVQ